MKIKLECQAQALKRSYLYSEARDDETAKAEAAGWPLSVAVSREAGTPAAEIAVAVGQHLQWSVYDGEILRQLARELHIDPAGLKCFDERRWNWLVECLESFSTGSRINESVYVTRLVRLLHRLASEGHCIFVGRGSAHVLPPASTVTIRLVGARNDRARALARKLDVSPTEAARMLDDIDTNRDHFIRDHFHREARDTSNYDLVLNTSHLTVADCAELIADLVQHRQAGRGKNKPADCAYQV